MVKMTPKLTDIAAENIITLGRRLHKAGLIDVYTERSMRNLMVSSQRRAAELVSLVTNKVEQDSQNFQKFLQVLEEDLDTDNDVAQEMKRGSK